MSLSYTREDRPDEKYLYQLQTNYVPIIGYTFSRGYAYEFTSEFNKISFEYVLPLTYLKKGIGKWIYVPRIYSKLFYDSTALLNEDLNTRTLNSRGIEFYFNTNTLRKFPLTFGLRLYNKELENKNHAEAFIASFF